MMVQDKEFVSVLERLPYPGHLLRIEDTDDMAGDIHRAYIWCWFDPHGGGERISAFSVQDGRYLTEVFPQNEESPND